MPTPLKGHIDVAWRRGQQRIDFQYNPTDLEFTRNVHIAEITIPGLDSPLLQFIRGNNETLAVTLFFDTTDNGMGTKQTVKPVTTWIDKVYALTKIDPDSHAPPVCDFQWGRGFPGSSLPDQAGINRATASAALWSRSSANTRSSPRAVYLCEPPPS